MKASELSTLLKGHGLSEDQVKASILAAIKGGQCDDDMGLSKAKASAVLADLVAKGTAHAAAMDLVKGQIAAGEVEDDIDAGNVDALLKAGEEAQAELNKAQAALGEAQANFEAATQPTDEPPEADDDDPTALMKGYQEAAQRLGETADRIIEACKGLCATVNGAVTAIMKGQAQQIATNGAILKAQAATASLTKGQAEALDALRKGIGAPMAPRHSDYQAEPHPGDTRAPGTEATRDKVAKAIQAEFDRSETSPARRQELFKARRELTEGLSAQRIASEYGIAL